MSGNLNVFSKAGMSWLLKMAWRDGKASGRRLFLFMASIVLGIAAVVSIQSFSDNLKQNIALFFSNVDLFNLPFCVAMVIFAE